MPNVYTGWAAQAAKTPLIVSPRGTLGEAPLSYSRIRKQVFWRLLQGPVVRRAACLHATCEAEYEEIRRFGLKQPVVVVPNGVDTPPVPPRRIGRPGRRRLLYLSRLHRKKGLEILLYAWSRLAERHGDWELRIVGPGEADYVQDVKRLAAELGVSNVSFAGPRYGPEKLAEYAEADLYVLPSFNENFGIAVAEALAMETPVVTTTGTPWSQVEANGCGWWVEPEIDALTNALDNALSRSPRDLSAMGRRGRSWMRQAYAWDRVASMMEGAYQWVLHAGAPPASIRLD
jgi:glycosyltransferase involved in cell wall biosynthesis